METQISKNENDIYILVSGVLDAQAAEEFHEKIKTLDYDSINRITIDFGHLSSITCTGIRELLIIRKQLQDKEKLQIINVNEAVSALFEQVGFVDIINISKSPKEEDIIVSGDKSDTLEAARESIVERDLTAAREENKYLTFSFKELLEDRAKNSSDRIIFIEGKEHYTWEDFNKCVQIAADDLYEKGVRKGSRVALCSTNSVNWLIIFFAIQKLGALALLVNFALRKNEIIDTCQIGEVDYFCYGNLVAVDDCNALSNCLTSNESLSVKGTYFMGKENNYKERFGEYEAIKDLYNEKVLADMPAIVIFTSGSTGKPKGVVLSAYNVLNASLNHGRALRVCRQDKICMILPMFHIFGLAAGIFPTLLVDGQVYFPENMRTDTILQAIDEEKCTVFYSVPTMILALVNNKNFSSNKVLSLRTCTLSGAAVSENHVYKLQKLFPNTHFTCAYGLSEFAPATITDYDDTIENIAQTVGKPLNGVEVRIDGAYEPNKDGEILLKGINLMTGYYKLAIEDQAVDKDGWLHTGDLGRIDEVGNLRIVGRIKELIIRGGESIAPAEIASVIAKNEMISDVKVVGVPDDFFGEIITAAVVLKQGQVFDERKLNEFLKGQMAKYKIPVFYAVYDQFPTMSNGKIDAVRLKKEMAEKASKL